MAGKLDFVLGNCQQDLAVDFPYHLLSKTCETSGLAQVHLGLYVGVQLGLGKTSK
jgi:hypothetical protein